MLPSTLVGHVWARCYSVYGRYAPVYIWRCSGDKSFLCLASASTCAEWTKTCYGVRKDMALPKRLGKGRNYEVRGRGHSVPFRKPPSHFPSIGAFDEGFELREEDDFLLVEAEDSMIR